MAAGNFLIFILDSLSKLANNLPFFLVFSFLSNHHITWIFPFLPSVIYFFQSDSGTVAWNPLASRQIQPGKQAPQGSGHDTELVSSRNVSTMFSDIGFECWVVLCVSRGWSTIEVLLDCVGMGSEKPRPSWNWTWQEVQRRIRKVCRGTSAGRGKSRRAHSP